MTPAQLHAKFATAEGSDQIASRFACEGLAWWLAWRRPRVIVEVGGGIGTLSAIIWRMSGYTSKLDWTVIEPNAWCWGQWEQNVGVSGTRVHKMMNWYAPKAPVEFLVLDGGTQQEDYYARLAPRAVVFVEGNRFPQRQVLERLWRGGRPYAHAHWKPLDRTKGFHVYLFDPTVRERVWFAAVRLREWALDVVARALLRPVGKKRREVTT